MLDEERRRRIWRAKGAERLRCTSFCLINSSQRKATPPESYSAPFLTTMAPMTMDETKMSPKEDEDESDVEMEGM